MKKEEESEAYSMNKKEHKAQEKLGWKAKLLHIWRFLGRSIGACKDTGYVGADPYRLWKQAGTSS